MTGINVSEEGPLGVVEEEEVLDACLRVCGCA